MTTMAKVDWAGLETEIRIALRKLPRSKRLNRMLEVNAELEDERGAVAKLQAAGLEATEDRLVEIRRLEMTARILAE